MSWIYSNTLATPRDRVRFAIGDTDTTSQLVQDEEIAAYVPGGAAGQATETLAAAAICESIAAKLGRLVDISEGSASAKLSQQAQSYRDRAAELRSSGSSSLSAALSLVGADADGNDTDPSFTRTLGDSIGAGDWPAS